MANAECHDIRPSKLAVQGQGKGDDQSAGVTAACHGDAEFEKRREEQKRRLLSTPAKPCPPHTEAELAVISSKRDLSEEAENLRAVQRAVSGRYYIGRKWMNPAQRLDMLVDPCS